MEVVVVVVGVVIVVVAFLYLKVLKDMIIRKKRVGTESPSLDGINTNGFRYFFFSVSVY